MYIIIRWRYKNFFNCSILCFNFNKLVKKQACILYLCLLIFLSYFRRKVSLPFVCFCVRLRVPPGFRKAVDWRLLVDSVVLILQNKRIGFFFIFKLSLLFFLIVLPFCFLHHFIFRIIYFLIKIAGLMSVFFSSSSFKYCLDI